MLLATQTISKATASTQKACRTCSSSLDLPANCTIDINNNINTTVVNCHVNFSSCPIKNCTNQKFCLYQFYISNSTIRTIFDLTILEWVFKSGCFKTEVVPNRCTFTNEDALDCFDGVSSENGSNLEVVEYQTEFNLSLPTERE